MLLRGVISPFYVLLISFSDSSYLPHSCLISLPVLEKTCQLGSDLCFLKITHLCVPTFNIWFFSFVFWFCLFLILPKSSRKKYNQTRPVWQRKWHDFKMAELKEIVKPSKNSSTCLDVFVYFWSCGISMIFRVLTSVLKTITILPANSAVNIFISHLFIEVHNWPINYTYQAYVVSSRKIFNK